MTDMTGDAERGDLEPTLREAEAGREKDRQRAQQLRRHARATFRAMEGWQHVHSEEDWLEVCEESRAEYESGRFLLERLGAQRYLDPKFMATLMSFRQRLIDEWGITTAAETMLVDLAILNYYHVLKVQGWIGDLALHLERKFFGQDAFAPNGQERLRPGARRAVDDQVRRLPEQLMPLADRANRMFIRNLKAIKELRQGLVPAIAIGRAEHVTVTNRQNGRARLRPMKRTTPEGLGDQRRGADPQPGKAVEEAGENQARRRQRRVHREPDAIAEVIVAHPVAAGHVAAVDQDGEPPVVIPAPKMASIAS